MQVSTVEGAHETQRERVYFEIRRALMAGDFEPGQKITIGAVASALGVSATPVREALRRLTAERRSRCGVTGTRFCVACPSAHRGTQPDP